METSDLKITATKHDKVKRHLMQNGSITSMDAIRLYWHTRLAVTINRLRRDGWVIKTNMVYQPNGTRYAIYKLIARPE